MDNKVLYHVSTQIAEFPEIRTAKYKNDFYFGFYCTLMPEQAERRANGFTGTGIMNEYLYQPDDSLSNSPALRSINARLSNIISCIASGISCCIPLFVYFQSAVFHVRYTRRIGATHFRSHCKLVHKFLQMSAAEDMTVIHKTKNRTHFNFPSLHQQARSRRAAFSICIPESISIFVSATLRQQV